MQKPYGSCVASAVVAAIVASLSLQGACAAKVVATTFPLFDWARNIVCAETDAFELSLLESSGADMHNFRPTLRDARNIRECDAFIQIGGESDAQIDKILEGGRNTAQKKVRILDLLGKDALDDGDGGKDEHVWLSPRTARKIIIPLAETLSEVYPSRRDALLANAHAYAAKLDALDKKYSQKLQACARKTLIVADRFPLAYLARDYGLSHAAAFSGCGAESEASFKTVVSLAGKADSSGAGAIMILKGGNRKLAETVNGVTKRKNLEIVEFDPMQSATAKDLTSGKNYLDTMEGNLDALVEALR